MALYELVLRAPEALVEPVSDLLMEDGQALSVSVEDADAGTEQEQALFGEPGEPLPAGGWQRSTLKALFETEALAEQAAALLLAQRGEAAQGPAVHLQSLSALEDADWVRLTQQQFPPVAITPGFWIVPSWHEPPAQAQQVLRLDPGLAFGTGSHPTTRMCLRWLAQRPPGLLDTRVLDYGCGSGILAIAAAVLGASEVDAVDIDPAAVHATRDNARRNAIGTPPLARVGLPDLAAGEYGVVLANILATPLKLLAPLLSRHVAPGGWLVLAGILQRQTGELQDTYAPWLTVAAADEEDGWVLLTGQRPTAS